jgi:hypothetical protein
MDRATILERLSQAERHVAEAEQQIARQRAIIAELTADGHDVEGANSQLFQSETMLTLCIAARDRLRAELESG